MVTAPSTAGRQGKSEWKHEGKSESELDAKLEAARHYYSLNVCIKCRKRGHILRICPDKNKNKKKVNSVVLAVIGEDDEDDGDAYLDQVHC